MNSLEPKKLSFDYILTDLEDNEEKLQEYERQQIEFEKQEKLDRYRKCGVPEKFCETSLDYYITKNQEEINNLKTVREFAENPSNRILVLCGNNGNGKTMLACGALRECGGEYVTSSQLCIEYEAGTSYHSKRTREEILKHYSTVAPLLVIDECGKYTLNQQLEQFILSYVLCNRYENNLASIVVTNGEKKSFLEFLGKSLFDRMTECCTTLDFTGVSKRLERRAV